MDEYISREEAVKKIKSCIFAANDAWESGYNTAMAELMEWIKHIPAADVQPVKHAQWIRKHNSFPQRYYCTNCGEGAVGRSAFCPNCGYKMGG